MEGATTRDGYSLGLLDNQMVPESTSTRCMANFAITSWMGLTPSTTAAFLQLDVAGVAQQSIGFFVNPIVVTTCSAASLNCR
jgi:hypothetical protein